MTRVLLAATVFLAASPGRAELTIVEERLAVDGLFWAGAEWRSEQTSGYSSTDHEFTGRKALLGITGQLTPVAALRFYYDFANLAPYDLYADFSWPSGFGLRAGQFIPPSATEALTELSRLKFINYSLVSTFWKPVPPRDVGVQIGYRSRLLALTAAVLNGNGTDPLVPDPNNWKDVAGRLVLKPTSDESVFVALCGYYGKTGEEMRVFWNGGIETFYEKAGLHVSGAVHHVWWARPRNSFYVQAAYQLGLIEPAGRLSMAFHTNDRFEIEVTGGLNFRVADDRVKVLTSYDYWRKAADDYELRRTVVRCQARLQFSF